MATMADAVKEAIEKRGGKASREEIRSYIDQKYPGQWEPTTLTAHLYGCVVNNPKAYIHHAHARKFLFRREDGSFELYNSEIHGENIWASTEDEEQLTEGEYYEASISLERDLETYLSQHLSSLEPGLILAERQVKTDVGFIDILAKDKAGNVVVIEIKVGEAKDSAIGQVGRYLGWAAKHKASREKVRG
ncbi:MAG: endonuclease NucS domain-containing protein, partial [Candidatus Methylomirabilis sp.]